MSRTGESEPLTGEEAARIVDLIQPCFDEYVSKYDERKYPPSVYERLLLAFATPEGVRDDDIRESIFWKFGHLGKQRIPLSHEALICHLQERWPELSSTVLGPTAEVHDRLSHVVGGPHRYITVAFFLHLLRPTEVPIIDQHNFRAMNYYLTIVRPAWREKRKPSTYADLIRLSNFLSAIRHRWRMVEPSTVPRQHTLDRFLMMYGKRLKSSKIPRPEENVTKRGAQTIHRGDSGKGCCIKLPFGGPGATFDANVLVQYLKDNGVQHIIQGQSNCALSAHRKPRSLDFWLRTNHAQNPDTKQAVNSVVSELVSSGLFEEGPFLCPDSGRLCKGIRIV